MQTQRILDDLVAMIGLPSVNPYDDAPSTGYSEEKMVAFLAQAMRSIGLDVETQLVAPGRYNVWGRLKGQGTGPALMLTGHMDTVDVEGYDGAPFVGHVQDGRVHGRGSVDMKGALACFLEVARQVAERPGAGDLILMFVCDEEHHMIGSKAAIRSVHGADFCIVGEPSLLNVCHKHPGQHIFPFQIHGRSVHSSRPEQGINAISGAAAVIARLNDYAASLMTRTPDADCGHARATPVLISGGESHSTVPGGCLLQVDRRVLPGEDGDIVRQEMQTIADSFSAELWSVTVGAPAPATSALNTPSDAQVAVVAMDAVAKVTGQTAHLHPFPGGTDAPNFGCPAVVCGPGDIAQAHTINEFIEIDQLEGATRVYMEAYQRLCGAV